jgi:glutathione S-transferase
MTPLPLLHEPAFQAYATSSALLVLMLYTLAMLTGRARGLAKAVVNREDVRVYDGASVVAVEDPAVQRVKRAHLNLIENAVPFFVLGLLYALSDPGSVAATALFGSFVLVRVLHAVFYLGERQPWRAVSWMAGGVINLVMLVQIVRAIV